MATERKYKIIDVLGKGGFGKVFLVKDGEGKKYAKKVINNVKPGSKPEKEVEAQKRAGSHKNIVKIFDAFYENDDFVIIMEHCDLLCLDDNIDVRPDLVESLRESFMLDMTRGVHHLHSLGIAHRDLKPANVMLVEGAWGKPTCKLADFGLVKMKNNVDRTIEMYSFSGTPLFMAPEVTKTGKGMYKKSCDVFSLGMIFYGLFSLKRLPLIDGKIFRKAGHEAVQTSVNTVIETKEHAKLVSQMLRFKAEDRPDAAMVLHLLDDSTPAVSLGVSGDTLGNVVIGDSHIGTIYINIPYDDYALGVQVDS